MRQLHPFEYSEGARRAFEAIEWGPVFERMATADPTPEVSPLDGLVPFKTLRVVTHYIITPEKFDKIKHMAEEAVFLLDPPVLYVWVKSEVESDFPGAPVQAVRQSWSQGALDLATGELRIAKGKTEGFTSEAQQEVSAALFHLGHLIDELQSDHFRTVVHTVSRQAARHEKVPRERWVVYHNTQKQKHTSFREVFKLAEEEYGNIRLPWRNFDDYRLNFRPIPAEVPPEEGTESDVSDPAKSST